MGASAIVSIKIKGGKWLGSGQFIPPSHMHQGEKTSLSLGEVWP